MSLLWIAAAPIAAFTLTTKAPTAKSTGGTSWRVGGIPNLG